MERFKILNLITLSIAFLALVRNTQSQIRTPIPPINPLPLCASQLALANYACSTIPYTAVPPPSPPSQPPKPPSQDDGEGHRHRSGHGHGRGRGRGHGHRQRKPSPVEDNCCRWAREVDSQCVCEILVRLPSFLSRPIHEYTVSVGGLCNVSYTCPGAFLRG